MNSVVWKLDVGKYNGFFLSEKTDVYGFAGWRLRILFAFIYDVSGV